MSDSGNIYVVFKINDNDILYVNGVFSIGYTKEYKKIKEYVNELKSNTNDTYYVSNVVVNDINVINTLISNNLKVKI